MAEPSPSADPDFVFMMTAHFERRGAAIATALLSGTLDATQQQRMLSLVSLELTLATLAVLQAGATRH